MQNMTQSPGKACERSLCDLSLKKIRATHYATYNTALGVFVTHRIQVVNGKEREIIDASDED